MPDAAPDPPPVVHQHLGTEVVVPPTQPPGPAWWEQLPTFLRVFLQLGFAGVVAALFVALVLFGVQQVRDAGAERDRQNATILRLIDLNHETQERANRETQQVRDNANRRQEQVLAEMSEWRREVRDIAGNTRDTQKAVLMLVEGLNKDHDGLTKKLDEVLKAVKAKDGDDGFHWPVGVPRPMPERAPPPRPAAAGRVAPWWTC